MKGEKKRMEKAVVIVDMPERCEDCKFRVRYKYVTEVREDGWCTVGFFDKCILTNIDGYDLDWREMKDDEGLDIVEPVNGRETCSCPLKPMPSNLDWSTINRCIMDTDSFEYGRCCGRQELIDELLGEENESDS